MERLSTPTLDDVRSNTRPVHVSSPPRTGYYIEAESALRQLADATSNTEQTFLQGNSEVTIDVNTQRYVHSEVLEEAVELLKEKGVVILCGPPGSGKTTVGRAILRRFRDEGFTPYVLSKLEEWHIHISKGKKSVVLMDGTLGKVCVNRPQHDYWESVRSNVLQLTSNGYCRLVLTLYPHVLRELQELEDDPHSPLLDPFVVVYMQEMLDQGTKETLLNFHLKELALDPDTQRDVVKKILQKDVSGSVFPWCCDQLIHKWESLEDPSTIFTVPAEAYVKLLKRMLRDPDRGETFAAVLSLAMKGLGGFLNDSCRVQPHLKELRFSDYSEYRLEEHADLLKGFILAKDGYGFVSRVLYEAAGLALGRAFSLPVLLQICDDDFLIKYISTEPSEFSVYVGNDTNVRWVLVQRINKLIMKGFLTNLCQQPCLLESLLAAILKDVIFAQISDCRRSRAKLLLRELLTLKLRFPMKKTVKFKLPFPSLMDTASTKSQNNGLEMLPQIRNVCYLDNPTLLIPDTLLSVNLLEDGISVDLPRQHWYLLLRLLTDREPDETDQGGNTMLHIAVDSSHLEAIRLALKSGASLSAKNKAQLTPYLLAQKRQARETVSSAVDDRCRGINEACRSGDLEAVKVALCHGASVHDKGHNGESLLSVACSSGHTVVASLLLALGANINAGRDCSETPPQRVSRNSVRNSASLLSGRVSGTNIRTESFIPLHRACVAGHIDVARLLLHHCADPNKKGVLGYRALHWACLYGHTLIARLLIQHGAEINKKGGQGYTPLYLASENGHTEAARLLLQHHADVNLKGRSGDTPLHRASENGHTDVARLLIQHGHADVDVKDGLGCTALHLACRGGHTSVARLLIQHSADVSVKDGTGYTALHLACLNGCTDVVYLLLQYHDNIDERDGDGFTALHWACQNDYTELARVLVQCGADINARNRRGDTPIDFARQYACPSLTDMLLAANEAAPSTRNSRNWRRVLSKLFS